jgi:hypothetical protein
MRARQAESHADTFRFAFDVTHEVAKVVPHQHSLAPIATRFIAFYLIVVYGTRDQVGNDTNSLI